METKVSNDSKCKVLSFLSNRELGDLIISKNMNKRQKKMLNLKLSMLEQLDINVLENIFSTIGWSNLCSMTDNNLSSYFAPKQHRLLAGKMADKLIILFNSQDEDALPTYMTAENSRETLKLLNRETVEIIAQNFISNMLTDDDNETVLDSFLQLNINIPRDVLINRILSKFNTTQICGLLSNFRYVDWEPGNQPADWLI